MTAERDPATAPSTTALRVALACAALALATVGCTAQVRRFPLAPPLWVDADRNPVPRRPAEYTSGLVADALDKTIFRPLARLPALPLPGEARNVNALDEVPDSAWFENRIGLRGMSPAEVARGACVDPPPDPARSPGPWRVTRAKTEGVTPGVFVDAPDGHRYLLKVDGSHRPERSSTADVVGSKLYHAAGFHAPCNAVVFLRRSAFMTAPGATGVDEVGEVTPLGREHLDAVLAQAFRLKDGRLRLSASRLLPGEPIGPHPTVGVRADDPNDVVPHEDRRELRGSRLLAAWINHFDVREQNSLDMWVTEGGRRFVRHYQLDFGDALGSPWDSEARNRRVGHAYFVDFRQMLEDLVTLGLYPRPWHHPVGSGLSGTFGYFTARGFVASRWKPIYPVPYFQRMTFRDALWMVRIIVRFSDRHLRAVVRTARLRDRRATRFLARVLAERRDRIAREFLRAHVPLAHFRLVRRTPGKARQSLCFEDLGVRHAGEDPSRLVYRLRLRGGRELERTLGWLQFRPDPGHPQRSCVVLPLGYHRPSHLVAAGAPDDHPLRYGVLTIEVQRLPSRRTRAVALHLYDLGPARGFRLVGVVRKN